LNVDKPLVETIQFDKRYLIENEQDTFMLDHFKTFFETPSIKSLNIKSPYGTGKTQLLKKIISDYNPQKVLWLSYRITLTNDILFNFTKLGFKSYQDGDYNTDRLIIQLESLVKLENNNDLFIDELESIVPSYDLIVIDEIESILNHFSSDTFNGKSRIIFEYLENIIKASNKVISLDGDLNNRSYQFLQTLGDGIYLENTCKINDKTLHLTEKEINFQTDMFKQLNDNNKVVICSMSSADASKYDIMLKEKYPDKQIYLYTGKSDDCMKKHHLSNVTEHWSKADVVIYSPTIEAGVNFDVPDHFNKIYGILSCQSTSQRAFFQMLSRIRKVSDKQIMVLNNITHSSNKDFWTFEEVKAGLIATRDNILQYKYVQKGNKIIKTLGLDNYDNNCIYLFTSSLLYNLFCITSET
jgi:nucleoside-triphosphatase THEP1